MSVKKEIDQTNVPTEALLKLVDRAIESTKGAARLGASEVCWPEHSQLQEALKLLEGFRAGFEVVHTPSVTRVKELPATKGCKVVSWRLP